MFQLNVSLFMSKIIIIIILKHIVKNAFKN